MNPTLRTKLLRASACRSDLLDNGIDLGSLDRRAFIRFVRIHLDYFQCMLGYDAGEREVVSLIRRAGKSTAMSFNHGATAPNWSKVQ
jgi:hypothetical protein